MKFRLGEVSEKYLKYGRCRGRIRRHGAGRDPCRRACSSEVYLADSQHQMSAVAALEPIYEAGHETERLLQVQRIKLARETDAAARVALLLRIGGLEARLAALNGRTRPMPRLSA